MLQDAAADGRRAHDERAIRDGFAEVPILFRGGEKRRGANRRAGFAKREFIGIYDPEMAEAEVAHRARGGADVEGISRVYQHNAQAFELGFCGQAPLLYNSARATDSNEKRSDARTG